MRVAVISDIHGNAHALQAVLAAIEAEAPEAVWCLGDTVGYGPRPNECCSLVQEAADVCLAGNHDLLALGAEVLEADFNPDASAAGRWTKDVLDEPSRACSRASSRRPVSTVRSCFTRALAIPSGSTCSAESRRWRRSS